MLGAWCTGMRAHPLNLTGRPLKIMNSGPTIVVLAAGQGLRFGGSEHKLTQRIGSTSVLGNTLRHALATRWPVVVVTTAALAAQATPFVAARELALLSDADAARGMGHSIAAGVAMHPEAPGWVVLPGDMPLVRTASIMAVGAALDQYPISYAQHGGRRGHPVAFAAELYSELVGLTGDLGARRLLARYPSLGIEVDDPGVLIDVDTESDLRSARAALQGVA